MKSIFVVLLSLFLSSALCAQSVTVVGKLIVVPDREGLPFATISVTTPEAPNDPVKRMATKEDGRFSVELIPGKYIFTFNFIGMNPVKKEVEIPSSQVSYDIGEIEMTENTTQLDEVTVIAQAPLVKVEIDKLTYNAKDDPESYTSNVLDLLRKVPLVTIDGEDEIQLKGSSDFKIYINGKPSNMVSSNPSQVLKSMPANSVKNVEVITDPGAKYDAEGVGGIINIVTDKRADEGYSGSVGGEGDTFGGYGGNAYLSTKYGKFGFTGNVGYHKFKRPSGKSSFSREATDPVGSLLLDGTNKGNGNGLFLNGSISFEPDTMNLFNISVSRFSGEFNSITSQTALSEGAQVYSYNTHSNSSSQFGGMNFAADYQRNFKRKGEMLTLSYRFERSPNDSEYESDYDEVKGDFYYPDGYKMKSINDAGGNEHTGQVDYVNPLNGHHTIEAGLKYIFRDNSSYGDHRYFEVDDNQWNPDLARKNDLEHSQNIASGYAGYNYKMGKIGLKVGLRGEQTRQEIHFMNVSQDTIIKTNFFDLVPSAAVSYQLGMTGMIRGGYNMRISRPGIQVLNPYVNDQNPNNITYGNPGLEAEQQHNFNINYGSFSRKLNFNATLSYSFTKNAVANYSFIERVYDETLGFEKAITHTTYGNIGRNHTLGADLFLSWTPSEMIRTYINGGVNYTDIQSTENHGLRNDGFAGRGFGGVTFSFPHNFRVGVNGGIFTSHVQLQTSQSPFYHYSVNILKSIIDKKMDISFSVQNLLSKNREFSSTTTGDGFVQKSKMLNPMRNFKLSITYRFGDLKSSMKKVQRSITNDDLIKGQDSNTPAVNVPVQVE